MTLTFKSLHLLGPQYLMELVTPNRPKTITKISKERSPKPAEDGAEAIWIKVLPICSTSDLEQSSVNY